MLEVREVVAEYVQRLQSRATIEVSFILVSPLLQAMDVLVEAGLVLQEVLIVVLLYLSISIMLTKKMSASLLHVRIPSS